MASTQCPHCSTRFKLPEEKLHSRLRCPKCREVFTAEPVALPPRSVSGSTQSRRANPPRKAGLQAIHVVLVLGLIIVLGALWVFMDRDEPLFKRPPEDGIAASPESAPPAETAPSQVAALDHPALRKLDFLRAGIEHYNYASIEGLLHLAAWFERDQGGTGRRWTAVPRKERQEYTEALCRRLSEDESLRALAANEPDAARIVRESPEEIVFELRSSATPDTIWTLTMDAEGDDWSVGDLQSRVEEPPSPEEAPDEELTPEEEFVKENFVPLDDSGGRVYKGEVARVELVPGTSEADAEAYRKYLNEYLGDDTLARNRATEELVYAGHPAIPVILNYLVERPLTTDPDRVLELGSVNSLLEVITHRHSNWPVPGMTALDDEASMAQHRQLSIEGWFGWWRRYGDRWEVWKKEANIPEPDPRRRRRN